MPGINHYHQLRRAQAVIVRYREFRHGELWEYCNRRTFTDYADRLAMKYFHKAKDLAVFEDIRRLYRAWLVLAPVIQSRRGTFKLDWHRGHFLTWIRQGANGRVGRFWLSCEIEKRPHDPELFRNRLLEAGLRDEPFVKELVDLYRGHYGAAGARGRVAAAMFDPFMLPPVEGHAVRVGCRYYRLEKRPHDGARDVRESLVDAWDYAVKYDRLGARGVLTLRVSNERIREFRDAVKGVMRAGGETWRKPEYKVRIIEGFIRDFVEDAKYAKSALPQVIELARWLRMKLRRLMAVRPEAGELPRRLVSLWELRTTGDTAFRNVPNFFWDPSKVEESVYMTFFSPYREGR